ncbi:MAG: hypothetical protein QM752_07625 [Gammaproteobacteria bacterium]
MTQTSAESKVVLSTHKQTFLAQPEMPKSEFIPLSQVPSIIRHYKTKPGYDIDIIQAGSLTTLSDDKKRLNQRIYDDEVPLYHRLLAELADDKTRYAAYCCFVLRTMRRRRGIDLLYRNVESFRDMYGVTYSPAHLQALQELMKVPADNCYDEKHFNKHRVSVNDYLLKEVPLKNAIELSIPKLQTYIRVELEKLNASLQGRLIDHDDMIKEVKAIQENCRENEYKGYIYTDSRSYHSEALIITKDRIIKPVSWFYPPEKSAEENTGYLLPEHFPFTDFYSPDLTRFGPKWGEIKKSIFGPYVPVAQAETTGCLALCFKTLKELLKNDAEQLKHWSFCMPFYEHNGAQRGLFIPPPQTLRYAQSGTFVDAWRELVKKDTATLKCVLIDFENNHTHKNYNYPGISKLLTQTIAIANTKNLRLKEQCQELAKAFPAFQQKWLAYHANFVEPQRKLMRSKDGLNRMLLYSAQKYKNKNFEEKKQRSSSEERSGLKPTPLVPAVTFEMKVSVLSGESSSPSPTTGPTMQSAPVSPAAPSSEPLSSVPEQKPLTEPSHSRCESTAAWIVQHKGLIAMLSGIMIPGMVAATTVLIDFCLKGQLENYLESGLTAGNLLESPAQISLMVAGIAILTTLTVYGILSLLHNKKSEAHSETPSLTQSLLAKASTTSPS